MLSEKELLLLIVKHCYREYERSKKEGRNCEKDYQAFNDAVFLSNLNYWKGKQDANGDVLSLLANHSYDVYKVINEVKRSEKK